MTKKRKLEKKTNFLREQTVSKLLEGVHLSPRDDLLEALRATIPAPVNQTISEDDSGRIISVDNNGAFAVVFENKDEFFVHHTNIKENLGKNQDDDISALDAS